MKTIDQRILIPIAPQVVWDYISDINNNIHWQVDYRNISFLSSRRSGPNVRWRYSDHKNREFVVETTAWYEGMGYEYTFIDGVPYQECTGRIRLQEIPEGTVVQWTFTYQYGGIFRFLRHLFDNSRQIEDTMVDSLRALWKQLNPKDSDRNISDSKTAIREGLSYEARVQYKPRHPSGKKESKVTPSMINPLKEPPITDEDTRPNRPITATEGLADAPSSSADLFDFPEFDFDISSFTSSGETANLDDLFTDDLQRFAPPVSPGLTSEPDFLSDIPNPSALAQAHETGVSKTASDLDVSIGLPETTDLPSKKQTGASSSSSMDLPEIEFDFSPPSQTSGKIPDADISTFDDEMVELFGPPQHKTSTQIASRIETVESKTPTDAPDNGENLGQPEVSPKTVTQPIMHLHIPEIDAPAASTIDEVAEQPTDTPQLKTATQPAPRFDFPEDDLVVEADEAKVQTSPDEMSIWEIFGLPRPSETQEHKAVAVESPTIEQSKTVEIKSQPEEATITPPTPLPEVVLSIPTEVPGELAVEDTPPDTTVHPLHMQPVGFRIVMRRKRVKLRRR